MNARLRDILSQLERETDAIDFLLPLPPPVRWCACEQPPAPEYADMRVYVCTDCGGVVVVDSDEVSK